MHGRAGRRARGLLIQECKGTRQDVLLRKAFRRNISPPVHYVPTAEGFAQRRWPGWSWPCTRRRRPRRRWPTGRSSESPTRIWQRRKLDSPMIVAVTEAVRSAAAAALRRV